MSEHAPYELLSDALNEARRLEDASRAKPGTKKVSVEGSKPSGFDDFAPEGEQVSIVDLRQRFDAISSEVWQALPDRLAKSYRVLRMSNALYWNEILDIRFALQQGLEWMQIQPSVTQSEQDPLPSSKTSFWFRYRARAQQCMDLAHAERKPTTLSLDVINREEDRGNMMGLIGEREGRIVSMSSWETQHEAHMRYMLTQLLACPGGPHGRKGLGLEQIDELLALCKAFPNVAALVHEKRGWVQEVLMNKGFDDALPVKNFYRTPEGTFENAVVLKLQR